MTKQLPVEGSWTNWTNNSTRGDESAKRRRKVDQVLIELHHTKVGRRLRGDFGRTLQRFFAAADTANLRITHKERNQWGCDGYRCVEYALVSEAFLREANGAVMCATEAA